MFQTITSVIRRRWWIVTTLVVVSIPLIILAIRWIVLGSLAGVPPGEQSIEANWAATIEKLGIEPRFPPEEDFVVGDLLALVVNDDDRNPYALNKIENAKTAIFTRRAVKLAYVDVKAALNDEYARLPLFSNAIESTPLPPPTSVPATPKSPKTTTLRRDFFTGVPLRDLPLAAFPRLKIQGTTSASAGISGAGFWGNFGAFNQNTEELELGEVRTYGLSSVRAHQLLDAYCEQQGPKIIVPKTRRESI